jgi:uncharacterized membrane protein
MNASSVRSGGPLTRPSLAPGVILGLGLGAFVDGIVLHQIVQWHNMGSARLPPTTLDAVRQNMVWDGVFHAGAWVLTVLGVYLLLRDARAGIALPGPMAFTGELVLGWGIFNVVEGVIDHHLLELHHVRDVPVHVPAYDWAFLAIGGVGFAVVGWWLWWRGGVRAHRARDRG